MMETDEALVERARAGDAEAFGVLIERHQRAVTGFLLSMLRDMDLAEEASQAAFVKAFQNLRSFEGHSSFKTWVSRIAVNAARSHMRWAKVRRWLPLGGSGDDEDGNWEDHLKADGPGGDDWEALDRKLDLERAMKGLPRREREVAVLRLEGYSLGEIAETLQVSEGTVKSTLFEATRKMRRSFS